MDHDVHEITHGWESQPMQSEEPSHHGLDEVQTSAESLLWSAKLSLPSPSRKCEVLERAVDLVQIKGLGIKFAADPVYHLLMLGVLRVLYSLQKARVPPDTTAILGRTGTFTRQAHRVALLSFRRHKPRQNLRYLSAEIN
jgi:hypothetical protein